jgi:hypothetical protein
MMAQVWQNSKCSGTELLMLIAIADYADDAGVAFPSVATLARKLRIKPRAVQYVVRKLVAAGELKVKPGGGRYANRYFITTPATDCTPATGCTTQPVQAPASQGCKALQGSGATAIAPEQSCNDQKNQEQYALAFEDVWKAYPERAGHDPKGPAFNQWKARLKDGHTPQELLEGAQRYRVYCEAKGDVQTQFVMQAKKFFGESKPFLSKWVPPKNTTIKYANFGAQDYSAGVEANGSH